VKIFSWQFSLKEKRFNCDPALPAFLGFSQQKSISIKQFFSCFEPHQATQVKKAFKDVLTTKSAFSTEIIINAIKHRYVIELSIFPVENQESVVEGKIVHLQLFPTVQQESLFLKEIFLHSEIGRMLATSEHIIIMVNKAFCRELGYEEHELIGKSAKLLKSGHYEPKFYEKLWETVNTIKVWSGELLAKNKQQQVYARDVKIQRFDIEDGTHFYFTSSVKLDLPSSVLDGKKQGDNDHSNVPDKAAYTQGLQQCYKQISSEQTIVVATFSVNWLQKISDFTACWLVSQRFHLTKQLGTLGIISNGIYSLYWVEDKNPDKIDLLLRQFLKAFSHGFDDSGFDLFSTANIGVSILSVDAKNPAQLISHSTQTLIANPAREHSSLYYFDPRLAKRFDRHQVLAKLLKEALNEKNIEVYYQPVVKIPEMKIVEFEALFRIKLETEIDYDTQELISIAETYNWIDEIDAIVTQIALAAQPKIQHHYGCNDIAMAINRSLANDRVTHCCLEDTIDILVASKADLSQVTIELTESAIFENFDQQKQWVEKLQSYGVKIAIDDFGSGYSSFAYLNNLPVNFIKIDRSFVTGITLESNEYAMIEMLCKLAHKIGVKVIAEGVETIDEFTLLSQAKVDLLQGYIFSKPVSLEMLLATPIAPYPEDLANALYQKQKVTVADICIKGSKIVAVDDRLSMIKQALKSEEHAFFVVLEQKKCVGLLYSTDFYSAISPYIGSEAEHKRDLMTLDKRVHQIMKKDFVCLHIDSAIEIATQLFAQESGSVIVIIDADDHYLGVTTVQALLQYQQLSKNESSH